MPRSNIICPTQQVVPVILAAVCMFLKQWKSGDDTAEIVLFLLLVQQKETEQRRVKSHFGSRGDGLQMPVLPVKLANSRQMSYCGGG